MIHCDWQSLRNALAGFRGYPYSTRDATGRLRLGRVLPQHFSLYFDNLYCVGADLLGGYGHPRPQHLEDPQLTALASQRFDTGFQDPGDLVFDLAQLQLAYATLPYKLASNAAAWTGAAGELGRFVSRKTSYSADNIPVPSGSFTWAEGRPDAIQEGGVPKTFPCRELVLTWCEIPEDVMYVVRARIDACTGKTNLTPFDQTLEGGGSHGYPKETILFIGAEETPRRRLWNGLLLYDISFRFLRRDNGPASDGGRAGWNHLFRGPGFAPQFQRVQSAAGATNPGQPIYQSTDLNLLFSVNPTGLGLGLGA